ncbi:hypothetical protein [uncultured Duncaniella sp.]|uniref:hypothetical protein n=1 Tax=uncultured Duncaniella sp. TaxID=2768039 RepID=UPI0025B70F84|nr:hypothetical protein [uncultured Duncaniella sp.]
MPRIKISQAAKEFNVTIQSLADQLNKKGISIDASNPNTRLDESAYDILVEAFQPDRKERERIDRIRQEKEKEKSASAPVNTPASPASSAKGQSEIQGPKVVGKISLDKHNNPIPTPPAPARPQKLRQNRLPHLRRLKHLSRKNQNQRCQSRKLKLKHL